MVEKIDDIERVFQDISNPETVGSLLSKKGEMGQTDFSTVHLSHKSQKFDLKRKLEVLETKSLFLENLCKENWASSNSSIEESASAVKKESMQENKNIQDLEGLIENLADTLQSKQKLLEEKLIIMEKKLSSAKNKKGEYELLKKQGEEIAEKISEKTSNTGNAKEQKEKKLQMDFAIKECNSAIDSIQHLKTIMSKEVAKLDSDMNHLRNVAGSLEDAWTNEDTKLQEDLSWLQEAVKSINRLGGVMLKETTGDSVVLEIPSADFTGPPTGDKRNEPVALELTLNFKLDYGSAVLGGASVNMDSLSIGDLVEEAIGSKDTRGFVREVKNRFKNHIQLLAELEELQKKYALDWDSGRVRVMLGKSGKVVCTLEVSRQYPAQSRVELIGVEGAEYDPRLNTLQSAESTLSQWLQHLQNYFSDGVMA